MLIAERPVQLQGSALARRVLQLFGWAVRFHGLAARQGVLIVYPHTSNWDFAVGMLAKWSVGLQVTFWGKDTLFRLPLIGHWLRWLGGVPVDRGSAHGIVGQMARDLLAARAQDRFLWLALAPEGTRRHAGGWRSGFYHVALQAQVPVGVVALDFRRHEVVIETFVRLSGDAALDLAEIAQALEGSAGCRPEFVAPIRFIDASGTP